jgi:uncharacterized iron-regulated membrane protein
MTIRKLIYWPHLVCGVVAGIVILTMSVTGVLLTYERQIIAWAETAYENPMPAGSETISIDEITKKIIALSDEKKLRSIKIQNNPKAPMIIRASDYYYINRYTGDILGHGPVQTKAILNEIRSFHRWFSMTGDNRAWARMITGAANLMFLFIVLSGMYLWIPKVFKWVNFKKILLFRKTKTSRARDFNWHNVLGIWSAVPLIVVIATATVFYYSWANNLVYYLAGEEPPIRSSNETKSDRYEKGEVTFQASSYDGLFFTASNHHEEWRSITMDFPKETDQIVTFAIDNGNGGEPHKKGDLVLDRVHGNIVTWTPFSDYSAGRKARNIIRFLHTGEALGLVGQTIAGLVSLFATVMVWTGLALTYRKYISPIRKTKKNKLFQKLSPKTQTNSY